MIFGGLGSGKTHLAAAIAHEYRAISGSALFVSVPEMLHYMRRFASSNGSREFDRLFERVMKAQFLVLDDFGEQSNTPWVNENIYQLVNFRYNSQLATVFTVIEGRDRVQERVLSRLMDSRFSTVVYMPKANFRLAGRSKS